MFPTPHIYVEFINYELCGVKCSGAPRNRTSKELKRFKCCVLEFICILVPMHFRQINQMSIYPLQFLGDLIMIPWQVFLAIALLLGDGLYNFIKILGITFLSIQGRLNQRNLNLGNTCRTRGLQKFPIFCIFFLISSSWLQLWGTKTKH